MHRPIAVQDEIARDSAIALYTETYQHYAETAQLYTGTELGATVAHTAMLFRGAARAEYRNPVSSEAPSCRCAPCRWYVTFGPKGMPSLESFTGIGRP
jgi:hypothetical protein